MYKRSFTKIIDSKHTPHWFTVSPVGQLDAQVKLFKTKPEAQAVQLSIVGPKQNVQSLLQD